MARSFRTACLIAGVWAALAVAAGGGAIRQSVRGVVRLAAAAAVGRARRPPATPPAQQQGYPAISGTRQYPDQQPYPGQQQYPPQAPGQVAPGPGGAVAAAAAAEAPPRRSIRARRALGAAAARPAPAARHAAPADTSPQPGDEVVSEPPSQKITNKGAMFSGLDKITGRIINFDVAIGETVQFGALQVTPRVCYTRPPTETPTPTPSSRSTR